MKILFWGNGDFGVSIFKKLVSADYDLELMTMPPKKKGRGRKMVSNNYLKFCNDNAIPVHIFDDLNSKEFLKVIKNINPDLNIVVDYGKIIPESILTLFPDKFINIHPSLLPTYRGASPIQTALLNGDKKSGVTIQKMIKELDAGNILVQQSLPIEDEDNFVTLTKKMTSLAEILLLDFLKSFPSTEDIPQNSKLATFCHKLSKKDYTTDWREDALHIHNKVRAFFPKPGLKVIFRNKFLKILKTELNHTKVAAKPGIITGVSKSFVTVSALNGGLNLLQVQPQDKKEMAIKDFINGYRPKIGEEMRSVLC